MTSIEQLRNDAIAAVDAYVAAVTEAHHGATPALEAALVAVGKSDISDTFKIAILKECEARMDAGLGELK